MASTTFDATGSAIGATHDIPLGAEVIVTKRGCLRYEGTLVVVARSRNGAYRVRFSNDTFVTAHSDEIEVVA